jgi:hypothetical protein
MAVEIEERLENVQHFSHLSKNKCAMIADFQLPQQNIKCLQLSCKQSLFLDQQDFNVEDCFIYFQNFYFSFKFDHFFNCIFFSGFIIISLITVQNYQISVCAVIPERNGQLLTRSQSEWVFWVTYWWTGETWKQYQQPKWQVHTAVILNEASFWKLYGSAHC